MYGVLGRSRDDRGFTLRQPQTTHHLPDASEDSREASWKRPASSALETRAKKTSRAGHVCVSRGRGGGAHATPMGTRSGCRPVAGGACQCCEVISSKSCVLSGEEGSSSGLNRLDTAPPPERTCPRATRLAHRVASLATEYPVYEPRVKLDSPRRLQ